MIGNLGVQLRSPEKKADISNFATKNDMNYSIQSISLTILPSPLPKSISVPFLPVSAFFKFAICVLVAGTKGINNLSYGRNQKRYCGCDCYKT